ncbi:MAG: RNase P subunit p30 family protein [Promethearchaeota archaeon]
MNIYADLHLNSNLSVGIDPPIDMINMASKLGYSYVCFADFNNMPVTKIQEFKNNIQSKIRVLASVEIIGEELKAIKQRLKNVRPYIDIITLKCKKKAIFNWALQDSRIDFLTFFDYNNFDLLTYEAAKLATRNSKAIEIFIRPLIIFSGLNRSKQIRLLRKMCQNIIRAKTPFILTSAARNVYEMRAARELIAIMGLADLPKEICKKAVSNIPLEIIKNRGL